MIRSTCRFSFTAALFVVCFLTLPSVSLAQFGVAIGTPRFGSFTGSPDTINLGNNNAHLAISVLDKPGRGQNFHFEITYDSSVWFPVGASGSQFWSPINGYSNQWGWTGIYNNSQGYITYQEQFIYAPCNPPNDLSQNEMSIYTNWNYMDQSGTAHAFSGAVPGSVAPRGGCTTLTPPPSNLTSTASDGSSYMLSISSAGTFIYTVDGNALTLPINPAGPANNWAKADRNGNVISATSAGQFYDTLSAATPALTQNLIYTAPSGATAQFVGVYASLTVQTAFGCSGISEYGPSGVSLLTEIDLPDYNSTTNPNSRYLFSYEPTPGHSGSVTGRLASVTLPTGGTITYSYSGGSNGIVCSDGSTATLTRVVNDGTSTNTWIYARSQVSGSHWQTTTTDPAGNQTAIDFQKDSATNPATYFFYETQRRVYQGTTNGTLLQTINTCYNAASSPCMGTSVTSPITQKSATTILPGASNLQSKATTFYNSIGLTTEVDEYDFGSGAPPSSPLRKTITTYASLGNNISNMPSSVVVQDGSGNVKAKTTYSYDETAVTTTTYTPQHNAVSGSRGNATTIKHYKDTSNFLTTTVSYFDTGVVRTTTDVNGAQTTLNLQDSTSTCGNAFPTSVSEPLSLSKSMTWNCTGGVQLTAKDEAGATTTTAYTDPYFWRPASVTDAIGAATSFCYGLLSNSTGTCTRNPTQVESTLNFNSNNSTVDSLTTVDGIGRPRITQARQSPSLTTFDSGETDYDALGGPSRSTLPYSGNSGQTSTTAPAVTTAYDALSRPLTVTDAGTGTVTYSYNQNDVLVTAGPAPTGESTKRRQLEYDGLGRLISVCEITTATGSGTCGQSVSQTGLWTKYSYDLNNNLIGVTQNAQAAAGSQQSRTYVFDFLSRLTSESNPENATTTYAYDSASGCTGTYNGNLVKRVDAVGNVACFSYDALHRNLSVTYPSGSYASITPAKYFLYDSATVAGTAMVNAKGRLAEAYTCTACPGTKLTDIGYSYTARGEVSDVYEYTPHSGGYYHLTQTYWPRGVPNQLSGLPGLPTITYGGTIGSTVGLDGKGRVTQVTASGTGQQNPVTATVYNTASLPTQVTYGSADKDIFAYDSNTLRMNSYQFTVGSQSVTGTLGWNPNGSLATLGIADHFNSADTQNCSFTADDLSRITKADCGTIWGQTFSYDSFGNVTKNKISGSGATSFTPTYQSSPSITNRVASVGGTSATYDANGNSTFDTFRTFTWDADGNPVTIGSVTLTYDAFDRMVEQTVGSTNSEIVYGPSGGKLALMNGTSLIKAFVPLPGGATAVYNSSGLAYYRHTDHLGTSRLSSTTTQTVYSDTAYSPFGEPYAQSGAIDPSFTGQNQDTTAGLYDFLYREYDPNQARWTSPDPAGLSAVNPTNPQSWNRYAYVLNNPLKFIDPLGLVCIWDDGSFDAQDDPGTGDLASCSAAGGAWTDMDMGGTWSDVPNSELAAFAAWLNSPQEVPVNSSQYSGGGLGSTSVFVNFMSNFVSGSFWNDLRTNPESCFAVFQESAAEPLHFVHHAADAAEQAGAAAIATSLGASSFASALHTMQMQTNPNVGGQLDPFLGPKVIAGARALASVAGRYGVAAEEAVAEHLPTATMAAVDASLAWGLINETYAAATGKCH